MFPFEVKPPEGLNEAVNTIVCDMVNSFRILAKVTDNFDTAYPNLPHTKQLLIARLSVEYNANARNLITLGFGSVAVALNQLNIKGSLYCVEAIKCINQIVDTDDSIKFASAAIQAEDKEAREADAKITQYNADLMAKRAAHEDQQKSQGNA